MAQVQYLRVRDRVGTQRLVRIEGPRPMSARQAERWLERLGLFFAGVIFGIAALATLIMGIAP